MNHLKATFLELEQVVNQFTINYYGKIEVKPIWEEIQKRPITIESIDKLIEFGLQIKLINSQPGNISHAMYLCNIIYLSSNLNGYERDKALFHEIVHAWYSTDPNGWHEDEGGWEFRGTVLEDGCCSNFPEDYPDTLIAEELARKLRTNPELLRHTILDFGLQPKIYDKISYQAFGAVSDLDKQLAFPFVKLLYKEINKILMD